MRKVWFTRDKHGPIRIHTELPREVAGSWLSDGPILTINTGELIALLGRDLEPGECSPPLFVLDNTDEIAARYEKSLELLELCYEAGHRQGWEDGPTSEEVFGKVNHFLSSERLEEEIFPPKDSWIPVEERLPEEQGCWCQVTRIIRNERWVTDSYWSGDYWEHDDVIAWKPIPEPYQPAE